MAAKPVVITGTLFPRDKSGDPYPVTLAGWVSDPSVKPEHPIVLPPDQTPPVEPPLEIWPPEGPLVGIEHPIVIPPNVPEIPTEPPATSTSPVKPNAWNWNDGKNPQYPNAGWYYVYTPAPGEPSPKRK